MWDHQVSHLTASQHAPIMCHLPPINMFYRALTNWPKFRGIEKSQLPVTSVGQSMVTLFFVYFQPHASTIKVGLLGPG